VTARAPSHPDCARCTKRKAAQRKWAAGKYAASRAAGKCVACGAPSGKASRCRDHANTHVDREWLKRHPEAEVVS
jgi:hypothetical protein